MTSSVIHLTCRKVDEKDLPGVIKFIEKYYAPRAMLAQIFKVDVQFNISFSAARAKMVIDDRISIGVFDSNGKMIRINMAQIQEKDKFCEYPIIVGCDCPKYKAHISFLDRLEENIFSKLDTNKIMVLCMGTGHPDYHGQRLWQKMRIYDLFETLALKNGCDYIVSSAVSIYTQKILKEAGFLVIKEIKYSEYMDPITGYKPDLNLSALHTSGKLMYKKILQKKGIGLYV